MYKFSKKVIPALFLMFGLLIGCKKDDKVEPIIDEENVFDPSQIPDLIENVSSLEIESTDSITLIYTEEFVGFDKSYKIDDMGLIPTLIDMSLIGREFVHEWAGERTVKIYEAEYFPVNTTLTLSIEIGWIGGEGIVAVERKTFEIHIKDGTFPIEMVTGTYPIDKQYYFLQDEFPKGIIAMDRLPADISNLSVEAYDSDGNLLLNSSLAKGDNNRRLEFDLPILTNETIYYFKLFENGNELRRVDFRTSKFNTFSEKISNLQTTEISRQILFLWEGQYVNEKASISTEGFDLAEAASSRDTRMTGTEGDFNMASSGLIQFEYKAAGEYFDNYLYPVLYESFPENFSPEYSPREIVDNPPWNAYFMDFSEELHFLLEDEINSGISTQGFQTDFSVRNFVVIAAYYDLQSLKSWLNENHGSEEVPERVERINSRQHAVPAEGDYSYFMNYTLPDGTITSSIERNVYLSFD